MNYLSLDLDVEKTGDTLQSVAIEISIDGKKLVNFRRYYTDLIELIHSSAQSGEFFILTCSCGDLGCAGINRGITVKHQHQDIIWYFVEPGPVQWFVFDHAAYWFAIHKCLQQGKELLAGFQLASSLYISGVIIDNISLLGGNV